MNAVAFVAEDETNPGNVTQIFGEKFTVRVRRDKLVSTCRQRFERRFAFRIGAYVDPLLGPARNFTCREKLDALSLDDMQPLHTKGITRTNDGGAIVRIVRGVHEDGDGIEALGKDAVETRTAFVRQERVEFPNDGLLVDFGETREEFTLGSFDEDRVGGTSAHGTRAGVAWGAEANQAQSDKTGIAARRSRTSLRQSFTKS